MVYLHEIIRGTEDQFYMEWSKKKTKKNSYMFYIDIDKTNYITYMNNAN